MSDKWRKAKIEEMLGSNNASIKQLGKILDDNYTKIEPYVLTIDKNLKQVIIIKLDIF